ncbi:RCC1 and BTB domain-containing protein 1 [Dermatophagoides pteronyssinus]|uniref:RCC1 and BTB domain-containing protein 1 n=1 Tax=Dermatophagoides pteronyssinus TaxID=6956 RepID=A0ABQ8IWC0_DERPT|nr:RCC1 and BTB domain-containing protein 1 [Dermatophagoides pteronyssinus]
MNTNLSASQIMKKPTIDTLMNIDLFQNDLMAIDREFLHNINSIFKISDKRNANGFLFMTDIATYAYGNEICKWISLYHDPIRPKRISILDGKKIIQADSGNSFVALLTNDGIVYIASGNSNWKTKNTFRLICTDNRFKMIACGYNQILLLRQDGNVFALGQNNFYRANNLYDSQLVSSYDTLVDTGLTRIKLIVCGWQHYFALTDTNQVYSWGQNSDGQLGLGDRYEHKKPSLVSIFRDSSIKNIVAGFSHSLFLNANGQIFGCGNCKYNINNSIDYQTQPIKISLENVQNIVSKNYYNFSLAIVKSFDYYGWGEVENFCRLSIRKLNGQPKSFAAASAMILESPVTFGLTTVNNQLESKYSISIIRLFNNPDNYDVEFVINDKSIFASKCYLRMESEYFCRMFSGDWKENKQVTIDAYGYDAYYAYLHMLHVGQIKINENNLSELIDLANCYGDKRLMKYCLIFLRNDLNEKTLFTYFPLIVHYELNEIIEFFTENKTMANSPDTCVDIELFQDDFHLIDREFIRKIVSIFCDHNFGYLLVTNAATYVFGHKICRWLSLKHDPTRPQQINISNEKKIIQVDSGSDFVAILTCDGKVYLASGNSDWQTNNTLRLISTGDDCYKMIACGCKHLLMLRQDGNVFALGANNYSQLTGSSEFSYDTLVNTGLTNVEKIACGLWHCLAFNEYK